MTGVRTCEVPRSVDRSCSTGHTRERRDVVPALKFHERHQHEFPARRHRDGNTPQPLKPAMTILPRHRRLAATMLALGGIAAPALAQTPSVTTADYERAQ